MQTNKSPIKNIPVEYLHVVFFVVLGIAVYWKSFAVPWFADDFGNIVHHPNIGKLYTWFMGVFSLRGVTNLTFALNYQINASDPFGYHVVNLFIHFCSSVVVYFLLQRVFRENKILAFIGGLIFLIHPVQTQAVTYIVQRSASLAGMFVFLGLLSWCKARESVGFDWKYYFAALFCGALAALSKSTGLMFPVLLLLFDLFFLANEKSEVKKYWYYYLSFLFFPMALTFKVVLFENVSGMVPLVQGLFSHETGNSPVFVANVLFFERSLDQADVLIGNFNPENLQSRYLATQIIVLWKYLRLLFFPFGQMLDYCYPLVTQVFNWKSIFAFLSLSGVVWWVFFRLKKREISFFVLWFLSTLVIESTIIPLDSLFEHRLYTPLFGAIIGFISIVDYLPNIKIKNSLFCFVIILFSILSMMRNDLWATPIAFWQDNANQVSGSYRPKAMLAKEYIRVGYYQQAIPHLLNALQLYSPVENELYSDLGYVYMKQGRLMLARVAFEKSIAIKNNDPVTLSNLGTVMFDLGQKEVGIQLLERAVGYAPEKISSLMNLAGAYYSVGRFYDALMLYRRILDIYPDNVVARSGLKAVQKEQLLK